MGILLWLYAYFHEENWVWMSPGDYHYWQNRYITNSSSTNLPLYQLCPLGLIIITIRVKYFSFCSLLSPWPFSSLSVKNKYGGFFVRLSYYLIQVCDGNNIPVLLTWAMAGVVTYPSLKIIWAPGSHHIYCALRTEGSIHIYIKSHLWDAGSLHMGLNYSGLKVEGP